MLIHLESGNLFYNNFNTQESFYDFLLNQQGENELIIKKKNIVLQFMVLSYYTYYRIIIYAIFYKVLTMKKLISSICSPTKKQNIYVTSLMRI